MIYLDSAATNPVRREVLEAMWPYLAGGLDGDFGNPSSHHELGRARGASRRRGPHDDRRRTRMPSRPS